MATPRTSRTAQREAAKAGLIISQQRPRVPLALAVPVEEEVLAEPVAPTTEVTPAPAAAPRPARSTAAPAPAAPVAERRAAPGLTRAEVPYASVRQLASPEPVREPVKASINVAVELLDAIDTWRAQRRRDFGHRAAISWLVEAALHDLPTEVDELRELADSLSEELTRVEPGQQSVMLSRETVERLREAADVLRGRRARGIKLWHAVSAALVRQLEAEGIPIV